jgi:hypothetical protein
MASMGSESILQQTLPGRIHQPGNVALRHLGEAESEAQYGPIGLQQGREKSPD